MMNPPLENSWQLLLELKLRRTTGNAFQTFFSDIMEARHGDDFIRLKPYGQLGDKGCDGYLNSSGCVFACYGAQNGAAGSVSKFVKKMNDDFDKAKSELGNIMLSWRMTHNIIEGLPAEAIQAMGTLKNNNPDVEFSFFGRPSIAETMAYLSEGELEKFLGRQARNEDYRNLQMSEIKELVASLVSATDTPSPTINSIAPVSPKKIEFNEIPATWAAILQGGRLNERHIQGYFDKHPIPTQGEHLANLFRNRYLELAAEKLSPRSIMYWLYVHIIGPEEVEVSRQVAAHTLLSYLFERCDIFENADSGLAE